MEFTISQLKECILDQELVHLRLEYVTTDSGYTLSYTKDCHIGGDNPGPDWITLDHVESRRWLEAEIKELESA